MFTRPTVFIVGAGASAEFGMPTGAELMKKVSEAISFESDQMGLAKGDRELFSVLKKEAAGDETKMKEFLEAAQSLTSTMSSHGSIDEALHYWSTNATIVQLGKVAIASIILDAEHSSKLFYGRRPRIFPNLEALSDVWLSHVFSMALGSLRREEAISAFENVTFINFNYDRTIERYLSMASTDRAALWEESEQGIVSEKLNIIRPYGSVGRLRREEAYPLDASGVQYGAKRPDLFEIAKSIRTFAEQHRDTDIEESIDAALEEAVLVVFLWFGFHQQNLALLRSKEGRMRPHVNDVIGTVLGIDQHNHSYLRNKLLTTLGLGPPSTLLDWTASKLVSDLRPRIIMIAG